MPSDLSLVRQIQTCDNRIKELSGEIAQLPKFVAEIEAKLASHKQQLAATQATLAENQKERRRLEGEIGAFKETISKLQNQMGGAKTNEQFRAFQHEIDFATGKISTCEDGILEKMEQAEALEGDVAIAQGELKIESKKVAAEVGEATARVAADQKLLSAEQSSRAELASKVGAQLLKLYTRIQKLRGTAMAAIVNSQCQACHVMLRPQFLLDMRNLSDGVMTCESCGRIAYFPEEAEDGIAVDDPAGEHNVA